VKFFFTFWLNGKTNKLVKILMDIEHKNTYTLQIQHCLYVMVTNKVVSYKFNT